MGEGMAEFIVKDVSQTCSQWPPQGPAWGGSKWGKAEILAYGFRTTCLEGLNCQLVGFQEVESEQDSSHEQDSDRSGTQQMAQGGFNLELCAVRPRGQQAGTCACASCRKARLPAHPKPNP